jgi:cell division protein FtsB
VFVVWGVLYNSSVPYRYLQLQAKITQQKMKNKSLINKNNYLKQKVMALGFDNFSIEREARDQLNLSRKGEYIINIPNSEAKSP